MPGKSSPSQKPIVQYEHKDKKRVNNPPVGLVDSHTDNGGQKKKTYEYDPHLDPQLQWAGKAEHTSFEVPTVSLHVHERIDPRKIIETVRKEAETRPVGSVSQPSLFETEKKPLREAIEFYKHKENWSNRLIAGDSLLVMNSLLEKEGMGGKVQMVYFDPPYGIKYGSNFQPFVNKRDVKDGRDEDLTAEPEMIKAFRDTWELGIHSYLTYLRDRLLLAKELLTESGSIFVQISDENVHLVRNLLDEVFGKENFISNIIFEKTSSASSAVLSSVADTIIFYAKNRATLKYKQLFAEKILGEPGTTQYVWAESVINSEIKKLSPEEISNPKKISPDWRVLAFDNLTSQRPAQGTDVHSFEFDGQAFAPGKGTFKTDERGLTSLANAHRLKPIGKSLMYKRYLDDFRVSPIANIWRDVKMTGFTEDKVYVVQTSLKAIQRCILMTTDPGDLVLDITCGSGTTAFVAENWGRRWITCDTSRVATALAKQRLMTADFDYFELAHPNEGVGSGFKYKTVPHITLKSIANNEPAPQETLYDQPFIDNKKQRVTGPFTVEAVPAPYAKSPDDAENHPADEASAPLLRKEGSFEADASVARSGETLRQSEWIDRLKDGIRGKGGAKIEFTRVEPLCGTHYLQAEAETRPVGSVPSSPQRVVICFGPEHAPLEQRLVEHALAEANSLMPKPEIILFCAFQFDPEARKDIEETNWPGITLLEAQMDADLQTDDLKKKPRDKTNPGFWLIGQPEVHHKKLPDGNIQVSVLGFDYYNPKTGEVESGGKADIAMWMLDPDYDDRSLFPTQVFFPMAGDKEGWSKLAKNLKAEIDEDKIEAFRGTESLPFKPGRKVAVKIIDARGIESLKIIHL
jgi:adenine-specific DNA-methyltransferase